MARRHADTEVASRVTRLIAMRVPQAVAAYRAGIILTCATGALSESPNRYDFTLSRAIEENFATYDG